MRLTPCPNLPLASSTGFAQISVTRSPRRAQSEPRRVLSGTFLHSILPFDPTVTQIFVDMDVFAHKVGVNRWVLGTLERVVFVRDWHVRPE